MPQPTQYASGLPSEITFTADQLPWTNQNATIPIYTFQQLDQCNVTSIRNKARFLVDKIGEQALPPLKASGTKDELMAWIIDVQIKTIAIGAKIVGVQPRHLGAPADWGNADDMGYFGGDNYLAKSTENYANGNLPPQPMHKVQPAHRGLNFEESQIVNREEAASGFSQAKARNAGSIRLG
uniref:Uncharacterized protein n=1 Tax=Haptolina brevifila TaxID=156173 RepID=A0A7S2MIZ4_9EUKA|eukprot:CAMPEP_0174702108 /NCGR_PEP_ID=MMETSP1094-20130205/6509_1 /TAXON_ID=156173 /ORGANISM="Chrysochromulina brevifilum, Strain UTEX LB 985" /LENGTH=180 /DNA_ID=CAMNT_0015899843 /DNA_START=47 /DNA_END=589 /DNA_ORIENTATION=+